MSTKSSLFLTRDNEHWYEETSAPCFDKDNNYLGDTIIVEFDKLNAVVLNNDEQDIALKLRAGTEIHSIISQFNERLINNIVLLKDLLLVRRVALNNDVVPNDED